MEPCRRAWEAETSGLDRDDLNDIWGIAFQTLVSTRDRLIHYKFLHRIYLTPARLARMFGNQQSSCWRCSTPLANFMHIFGDCPQVKPYWQAVASCIRSVTSISIPMTVEVCLLHLVEPLAATRAIRTLLTLLLFYAKKRIILSWKSSSAPTLESWKA